MHKVLRIRVVVTHKEKETEYLKFPHCLALLDYQLGLGIEQLDEIESFDVYPEHLFNENPPH